MSTTTTSRPDARHDTRRNGFFQLVHAEWTKFRTVRGWVIGMIVAGILTVLLGLFADGSANIGCQSSRGQAESGEACLPYVPHGPGGEVVTDSFNFARQPLTGNGSITVRVLSLSGAHPVFGPDGGVPVRSSGPPMTAGLMPWSKAGIIIKQNTRPGSAYAAMMVTGSNGVRMQYNYTGDIAGLPGSVTAARPRWLRLTRAGDTITGYDSADGAHWTKVGAVRLAALPATVQVGMFATSPGYVVTNRSFGGSSSQGAPSQATGVFDDVTTSGTPAGATWTDAQVGGGGPIGQVAAGGGGPGRAGFAAARGTYRLTGSGDIAPEVPGAAGTLPSVTIEQSLAGAFIGLIAIVVVAAMFFTAEYRRGLIRTTLAATPQRGAVLAAKAIVIGAVTFAVGLLAATVAIAVGVPLATSKGQVVLPVPGLTEIRVVVGMAAMLAVVAVFATALGAVAPAQCRGHLGGRDHGRAAVPAGRAQRVPGQHRGLGDAAHPRGRAGDPAEHPDLPPGHQRGRPRQGHLPAAPVRRARGGVLLGGGRAGAGAGPAAAARRMSTALQSGPAESGTATATAIRTRGTGLGVALHAEWTKLRTVSGPSWLLLGTAALTIAVSAAAAGATSCPAGQVCPVDPVKLSLTGIQFGQAVVAILAVLTICNEYSTGLIRVTFAAMPRRLVVLAAKAIITAGVVLVAGAVAVLGSVLAGNLILPGHGFTAARGFHPVSLSYGPVLRAAGGSVLYLALIALLSLGIAAIVRDSAVSIGSVLAVLYLFPIMLAFVTDPTWQHRLSRWTPTSAGLAIQATTGLRNLPISPWDGLGVLAIWAAAALLLGGLVLRFRDA